MNNCGLRLAIVGRKEGSMRKTNPSQLSRRERQIMDIIYKLGKATAAEVQGLLPDPPSYSAVRAMLRILEEKDFLEHEQCGPRYVFKPVVPRAEARKSALQHILKTFFDGSAENAMAALLDISDGALTDETYQRLRQIIDKAREEGR
jgi:BlaI family penicillinase repressor